MSNVLNNFSKISKDIEWSQESLDLLSQIDKESIKSILTVVSESIENKNTKEAALIVLNDLSNWSKLTNSIWVESYLITHLSSIITLTSDKQKSVQITAEKTGNNLMNSLNPYAVDGIMPILFKHF